RQQSGRGVDAGTRAHRREPGRRSRRVPDPVEQGTVLEWSERAAGSGDDDEVRVRQRARRVGRYDDEACIGPDGALFGGDEPDAGVRPRTDHLVRTDQVERREAIVEDERDLHAGDDAGTAALAARTFSGRFLPAEPGRKVNAEAGPSKASPGTRCVDLSSRGKLPPPGRHPPWTGARRRRAAVGPGGLPGDAVRGPPSLYP